MRPLSTGLCTPEGWKVLVAGYGLCRGLGTMVSHSFWAMAAAHAGAEEPPCPQPCTAGHPCLAPFSPQAGSGSCSRRLWG